MDRTAYTQYVSGRRADLDADPATFSRELQVRSLTCGTGFADAPTATFVTVFHGVPIDPPLPGPCWQAQVRFARDLP